MPSFNFCVPARLFPHGPNLWGLTGLDVVEVFGDDTDTNVIKNKVSMVICGLLLIFFGYWTLFPQAALRNCFALPNTEPLKGARRSVLRNIIAAYQVVTGVFFVMLCTQLNTVVVVFAALHNWFEWLLLGHIYIRKGEDRVWWNRISSFWIWIVILIILAIPDVLTSFAFEEVVGLWPDWQLFFISWYWYKNCDHHIGLYFGLAATFHLIQIITLLVLGLGMIDPWPTAQVIIALTAVFNYFFYSRFAHEYDLVNMENHNLVATAQDMEVTELKDNKEEAAGSSKLHLHPSDTEDPEVIKHPTSIEVAQGSPHSKGKKKSTSEVVPLNVVQPTGLDETQTHSNVNTDDVIFGKMKPICSPCGLVCFIITCLGFSTTTVVGPVVFFGNCVNVSDQTGVYTQTTQIAVSSEDATLGAEVEKLLIDEVIRKRNHPNNLQFKIFKGANEWLVYEEWDSGADTYTADDVRLNQTLADMHITHTVTSWDRFEEDHDNGTTSYPDLPTYPVTESSKFCTAHHLTGYTYLDMKEQFVETARIKISDEATLARTEPGNIWWIGMEGNPDSSFFFVLETWKNQAALNHHLRTIPVLRLYAMSQFMTTGQLPSGEQEFGVGFREVNSFDYC